MAVPVITALWVGALWWSIGRAIVAYFLAAATGMAVYALSKFAIGAALQNIVLPSIPAQIGCAMKTLEFSSNLSIIIAAYHARLLLWIIAKANKLI